MTSQNSIDILSVGGSLAKRIVTNDELSHIVETSDEWITTHTGIKERRFSEDGVLTSDLAVEAALSMGVSLSDVDGVIVATATPDYKGFPSTACIIVEKLHLNNVHVAFDMAAGCTGFIYALETARALVVAGTCSKLLIFGAETMSSVLDFTDRNTCVLFGDGAGCALVAAGSGLKKSIIGVEGSGAKSLYINSKNHLKMDGRAVYKFAVARIVEVIQNLADDMGTTPSDITWIVPHQANERIIRAAAARLHIREDKFFLNVDKMANTSAASIPLALWDMDTQGKLKKGDSVLLIGFGAGLTYGGNYLIWNK